MNFYGLCFFVVFAGFEDFFVGFWSFVGFNVGFFLRFSVVGLLSFSVRARIGVGTCSSS